MSDVLAALSWWLVIQVLGFTAVPLAFRVFRWLPDRGYSLSKAMGVLLVCYLFWLLNTLGFLQNSAGSILLAAVLVLLFSMWVYHRRSSDQADLVPWLKQNWRLILWVELFFAAAFVFWAVVRAQYPDITATEKPMDLAFINSILQSRRFPPRDPWLSGFAISYYYFGYLITAAIAKLSGVPGSIAFNLGLAWQFAGALLGGFGLVYNLVAAGRKEQSGMGAPVGFGLLGGLFVGVMGNLEGFLEVLHNNAILPAGFWKWLDINEINALPPASPSWPPRSTWWWWRASRVIHDRDLTGASIALQPIDEFPFFSFLLGDMHPHVLVLPFSFVVLALALNWWLKRWEPDAGSDGSFGDWLPSFIREADPLHLLVYVICVGAIGFLNTWDLPFYLFVVLGALVLAQLRVAKRLASGYLVEAWLLGGVSAAGALWLVLRAVQGNFSVGVFIGVLVLGALTLVIARIARAPTAENGHREIGVVGQMLAVAVGFAAACALAYLPFYLGLRTQAGGLLPNIIYPTWLPQFLVMFGPFLFVLALWLLTKMRETQVSPKFLVGVMGGILALLMLLAAVFGAAAVITPQVQGVLDQVAQQMGGMTSALRQTMLVRLTNPWTALFLLAMIAAAAAIWQSQLFAKRAAEQRPFSDYSVTPFVLLLVLTAAVLALAPEFVYLKDNFGTRMNTIFKFYYQAWVMWAVASGYALYSLLKRPGPLKGLVAMGAVFLIAAGMFYPVLSIATRTNNFGAEPDLDGMAYLAQSFPGDYAAINWLAEHAAGDEVILEAIDGQYSWGGRISVHTGLPTVLGWAGHEYQWRGDTPEPAVREQDVSTIYTSRQWSKVEPLLNKYEIEYVVVGFLETSKYGEAVTQKFERILEPVFRAEGVTIYQWDSRKQ